MTYVRINSWKLSEEEFLINTLLQDVRQGLTVRASLKQIAEKLSRPYTGCSFHWYGCLKAAYEEEFQEAKRSVLT